MFQLASEPGAGWRQSALCAQTDPEAFFPQAGGSAGQAKQVCTGCPVVVECLQFALDHDESFGVWGGLSEQERRKLRRSAAGPRPEDERRTAA